MTRPSIVTTQADGTHIEREMNDEEYAEYQAKAEQLAKHMEFVHAKMEDRAAKLANP